MWVHWAAALPSILIWIDRILDKTQLIKNLFCKITTKQNKMSYFYKNRTRVIIFGSSSWINLVTLYCHVIILVAEGFGLGYNVEMSQLKIIPVFFFSFQTGYLLIYIFIHIGRVDDFHSPCLNLKWPTLTHPSPSTVKTLAPTRHASPSGRSVRQFVFMWPR